MTRRGVTEERERISSLRGMYPKDQLIGAKRPDRLQVSFLSHPGRQSEVGGLGKGGGKSVKEITEG